MANFPPYRAYRDFLIERYGERTYKLTISGGRTCPTRDGSFGPKAGWGGCSFCDVYGSASYYSNQFKEKSVREQMELALPGVRARFKAKKFIAYFQSYTSTYEEIGETISRYQQAIEFPDVVCLAVGTRPDCIPDAILTQMAPLLDRVDLQIELGVQSFNEDILVWLERGHDVECAVEAVARIQRFAKENAYRKGKVDIVIHLIFGSPQETDEDIIEAAQRVNALGVSAVKLHHLHILRRTKLAAVLKKTNFPLIEMPVYLQKVALFLRHLHPDIVVHRTHAKSGHYDDLIGPAWSKQRANPVEQLRLLMNQAGWRQGDLLVQEPVPSAENSSHRADVPATSRNVNIGIIN